MKHIKILLLVYLLAAVLLPSYEGYENSSEFHFFEIVKTVAEYRFHGDPEIEANQDRSHSHDTILYYPGKGPQLKTGNGHAAMLAFAAERLLFGSTVPPETIDVYHQKRPPDIIATAFSGLSPPIA